MSQTAMLGLVGAAILAGGGGCAACRHQACGPALAAGPACPTPLYNRQQVYVFLVNGVTPCTLDGLRDKLAEGGWTKVYYGQLPHAVWMGQEMRRLANEDATTRFVIVGFGLGGAAAAKLAGDAVSDRLPVEAVVLLDPSVAAAVPDVRTVVVTSAGGHTPVPNAETVSVPDASRYSLPTHAQTVAVLTDLLADVAGRVPFPPPSVEPDWVYEHAPPVLPYTPSAPTADPAWNFLRDTRPPQPNAVQTVGYVAPAQHR